LFQQSPDIMKGPNPQPVEFMVRDLVGRGHEAVAVQLDMRQTGLPQRRTEVYVPTRRLSAEPDESEFKRLFLMYLQKIIRNTPTAYIREILLEDCGEPATQSTLGQADLDVTGQGRHKFSNGEILHDQFPLGGRGPDMCVNSCPGLRHESNVWCQNKVLTT
jgi:hypothetical protein